MTVIDAKCGTGVEPDCTYFEYFYREPEVSGKISFNNKTIKAIKATDKRQYFYDSLVPGLELMVTPNGSKTFYLKRRIQGESERVKIGSFPAATPEQARARARELNAEIVQGGNPARGTHARGAKFSVEEAFTEYMSRHSRPQKKSWPQDQGLYDRYIIKWKKRQLGSIDRNTIQKLHSTIGTENGKYVANRVLSLIHTMLGKMNEWGYISGDNPASKIQKFKEKPRERYLNLEESEALLAALEDEPDQTAADIIRIGMFTGARKGNVCSMRWEDIYSLDGEAKWLIPETKSGKSHGVPLVENSIEVLKMRRTDAGSSPWVFQGTGKSGHYGDPRGALKRACLNAGLSGVTFHTFRHSVASLMTQNQVNVFIIQEAMGHQSINTTKKYSHLADKPIRDAIQKTTGNLKGNNRNGK